MADVKLRNGRTVTAHCANSGSMKGCCEEGRTVYLSRSDNEKRRLRYTWEMIDMASSLVGVNTSVPNRLVARALQNSEIKELTGYEYLRREVKCGADSRLDLLLERSDGKRCFIEIKNCTLVEQGTALFPDAVTSRGLKHLVELQSQVEAGNRGVIFFLIQRMDAAEFGPADLIDPKYGLELRKAASNGVEILAYDVALSLERIVLNRRMPVPLSDRSL
jgi:sugar fermentation stimulation protein A